MQWLEKRKHHTLLFDLSSVGLIYQIIFFLICSCNYSNIRISIRWSNSNKAEPVLTTIETVKQLPFFELLQFRHDFRFVCGVCRRQFAASPRKCSEPPLTGLQGVPEQFEFTNEGVSRLHWGLHCKMEIKWLGCTNHKIVRGRAPLFVKAMDVIFLSWNFLKVIEKS